MVNIKILMFSLLAVAISINAAEHSAHNQQLENQKSKIKNQKSKCIEIDIQCAKTVTSAFDPHGNLWRLWSQNNRLFIQTSNNKGSDYSSPQIIESVDEKISTRGENRPKLGFDHHNGIYISWASPKENRFTADIRFVYSLNNGKDFSSPITINDDELLAGHSFNEMLVQPDGKIVLTWLDSRQKVIAKKNEMEAPNGSSIYFVTFNPRKVSFEKTLRNTKAPKNTEIISGTCQCCRLSLTFNQQKEPVIFWRHIFGENTREFSVMTLDGNNKLRQVSFDEWKIDGCPHQGGSISIDEENRYHMVWNNQGEKGKGIFYSVSDDQGLSISKPLAIAPNDPTAAHPHLIDFKQEAQVVWASFNGKMHQLWYQSVQDRSKKTSPTLLKETELAADRPFLVKDKNSLYVSWQVPGEGHFFKAVP